MEEKKISIMHYLITAIIIFGFRFLPTFGAMTPYGMGILGTFIGAVYGWSTIGMVWPSFMALVGLGLSIGMTDLLYASFGNPVVAALFALFPMMAVLSELRITEYVANAFLTNKLQKSKQYRTIDLKKDMKKKCLKTKEYIHSLGEWNEYIEYLKKEICK